jgi:hypothetical protein
MPLGRRYASALLTPPIGEMAAEPAEAARSRARVDAAPPDAARLTTVSTSVFHASHEAHWPDQRGELAPHCWQT